MTPKGQCGQSVKIAFYHHRGYRDWRITVVHETGDAEDVAQATSLKKLWRHMSTARAKYGVVIDGRPFLREQATEAGE